jgi:outer membrane protein OmpA-like peptidoglycan-associated protein
VLANSFVHLLSRSIAEEKRMYSRVLKSVSLLLALGGVMSLSLAVCAQDAAKPAAKAAASDSPSRWDIFAGYSYLAPKGTVQVPQPDGTVVPYDYDAVNVGGLFSASYFFNKYVGAQGEFGIHEWGKQNGTSNVGDHGNNDGFLTVAGGLIARYPTSDITPFVHALVGTARVDGPDHNPFRWGPALTVGGGVDYNTPLFNHHLAIRVFQADFEYIHADFGDGVYGGRANIKAPRLSAGLVYHIGSIAPPPPVTLACSASPTTVFPGDPVTVTATAGNLDPKLNVIYSYSGDGVTGNGATATVATASLAPGSYTVKCGIKEGKHGKEGLKPWESADATATYTVKQFEPPTVSCSASPSTIKPGEGATVTASGLSPQNRPLTYSYSAQAGTITGSGATASFSSTGAPTGAVGITCNVSDDKGQTATSNTTVTITAPYVAPAPHTQALCTITFDKDKKRPTRVDNEAKACLDEVALDLQKQSDAKAVVVGTSDAKEKAKTAKEEKLAAKHKHLKVLDPAAERAVNTKAYLVTEKGIDASRITVATSTEDGQKVEDYLVPSGATFSSDVAGTTPVDETAVKPVARKPLGAKGHKKHAAPAAK